MLKYRLQKEEAEIRTLLSIVVDDIKYAKNRQWSLTYYVLLTYAALIGLCKLIRENAVYSCTTAINISIIFTAFVISFVGVFNLLDTHMRIAYYRHRLENIKKYLSPKPRAIINIRPETEQNYSEYFRYFSGLTAPFIFVLLIGLYFVTMYVLNTTTYIKLVLIIFGIFYTFFILIKICIDKKKMIK